MLLVAYAVGDYTVEVDSYRPTKPMVTTKPPQLNVDHDKRVQCQAEEA